MSKQNRDIRRRRSRSLVGFQYKDLCETVPKSLPPSERLLMLIELSYQLTLSAFQKEFMNKDFDIGTFREKSTECWEKIKAAIEEKDLVKLAVSKYVPHDESLLSSNVEECNEAIAILKAESDKWNDQISHYRNSLENKIKSSYEIDASEWKGSDHLYDYSNVIKSASSVQEGLSLQINTLSEVNVTMNEFLLFSKILHNNLKEKEERCFTPSVPCTPRTILKNMASTRVMKP